MELTVSGKDKKDNFLYTMYYTTIEQSQTTVYKNLIYV